MAINKHKQVVCDKTGIILEDGVTLYPGYIEVKDNMLTMWDSKDPENERAKDVPYILHNRVEFKYPVKTLPCSQEQLQGKHFISLKAMESYLTKGK